jgi:hypothetical protein
MPPGAEGLRTTLDCAEAGGQGSASSFGECGTSRTEAHPTVGAPTNDMTVVVVLSVVFPAAPWTDVAATLGECGMAATGSRVRPVAMGGDHIALRRVGLEPPRPLGDQFIVTQRWVLVWSTLDPPDPGLYRVAPGTEELQPLHGLSLKTIVLERQPHTPPSARSRRADVPALRGLVRIGAYPELRTRLAP